MNFQIYKPILVFLMLEIVFVHLILEPPVSDDARLSLNTQKNIMRFFSIVMFIIAPYGFYPVIKDTFCYLKNGDKYIKETKCIVKNTTTTPIFFFARKDIYCDNNQNFQVFFTFHSYTKTQMIAYYRYLL